MLKVVKAARAAAWGLLAACAIAPAAFAVPVDERELGRFVPALGFVVGLAADRAEGHMITTDVLGPQDTDPSGANPVQPLLGGTPATARTAMLTPTFGASLELMTPAVQRVWGRPRVFGRFDLTYAFGAEYFIPSLGDPGPFAVAPGFPGAITEGVIQGQGGWTRASTDPLVLAAAGGIAITTEIGEHAVRFKPSVEYMRQDVTVAGLLRRAVALSNSAPDLSGFREVTLSAQTTETYHWLGPGIEVDVDAARVDSFVFSPYVALKAFVVLNDDKVVIQDSNQWDETAVWTFLPNRWAFGGTVGVRVRWAPE